MINLYVQVDEVVVYLTPVKHFKTVSCTLVIPTGIFHGAVTISPYFFPSVVVNDTDLSVHIVIFLMPLTLGSRIYFVYSNGCPYPYVPCMMACCASSGIPYGKRSNLVPCWQCIMVLVFTVMSPCLVLLPNVVSDVVVVGVGVIL